MTVVQGDAHVVEVAAAGPYRRVRLRIPPIAARLRPGQFAMADLGGALRAPWLPSDADAEELDVLLPSDGRAVPPPGGVVNLLGPLGRPLDMPAPPARLLLVADDRRLPALLLAARRALAAGCPVSLLLSAPSAAALYPLAALPPALEVHLVTADGSAGRAGSPLELLTGGPSPLLSWADRLLAATDPALYPALAQAVRATRLRPPAGYAQALYLPTVVCGVGACGGCAVPAGSGYRRACSDGPFFDLLELEAV